MGTARHREAMTSSVALCEALTSAAEDRARARISADAFGRLDERYPLLSGSRHPGASARSGCREFRRCKTAGRGASEA